MTRDEARDRWTSQGFTCDDLNRKNLQKLRNEVNQALANSPYMNKTFRANQRFIMWRSRYWLKCQSDYFFDREAISFYPEDNFVGFAGWADDKNIQPILEAFDRWMDWMISERDEAKAA